MPPRTTRHLALCVLAALGACHPAPVETPAIDLSAEVEHNAARIAATVLGHGRALKDVTALAGGIGARPTGSAAFTHATAWAEERLRAAEIPDVHRERFTVPASWERGEARGRIVSPEARPLHLFSVAWAPPTPAGGIEAEVVSISDVSPAGIAARAPAIAGRIVLLDVEEVFKRGFDEGSARIGAAYRPLRDAGAKGVLWPSRLPGNEFKVHTHFSTQDTIAPLPLVDIGKEDTRALRELMKKGPVVVSVACESKVGGPVEVANVIGEIPGREDPDAWVLVGAHLDSWDWGPGAQDDGTGVAMVLDAARAIAALDKPPRRSIRFALWAAEEQGLLGATAYAKAHADELDRAVAVLNTDEGTGTPKGWHAEGRQDVAAALMPFARTVLDKVDAGRISLEVSANSDHAAFWREGVPALNLWVDDRDYFRIHHQAGDTLDKVNRRNLRVGAAVVAMTAYGLADAYEGFAPRLDRAGVEGLLKQVGLYEAWTAAGKWR